LGSFRNFDGASNPLVFFVPPDILPFTSVQWQGEGTRQGNLYVDGLPNSYAQPSDGEFQQELALKAAAAQNWQR
jgi:hypothetical protein